MSITVDTCVVALLGRDDGARQQLRQALEDLGANVAFEGDPAHASEAAVLGVGPNVVILNLEESADGDFDHLQAVLDDPSINVVFNDSDVSRTLEGWDLARWARHLAAKVLGHDETMPPPPDGAERLIVPDNAADDNSQAEPEAAEAVPVAHVVSDVAPDAQFESSASAAIAADGIESALPATAEPEAADDGADADMALPSEPAFTPAGDAGLDDMGLDFDVSAIEGALEAADEPAPERVAPTPEGVDEAAFDEAAFDRAALGGSEYDVSFSVQDEAHQNPAAHTDLDTAVEAMTVASDLDDFSWSTNEAGASTGDDPVTLGAEPDESAEATLEAANWAPDDTTAYDPDDATTLDEDVAALAASLDAFETGADSNEAVVDLDFSDAVAAAGQPPAESGESPDQPAQAPPKSSASGFGELSLSALDEAADATPAPEEKPAFDFSRLDNLSLEPLDDVDAEEAEVDPLLVAMGLADAPSLEDFNRSVSEGDIPSGAIEHVLVLGASIGGPDAIRSFLNELPKDFPAVVVLVQHLESGYFERLSQQLQKSSVLPVKVAQADTTAVSGEVLVIPASHRVKLEADGRLIFDPHPEPPRYTPSIDEVLHDVADRFGKRATAIIFSGMAGDAVEGAAYLVSKGGEVWAQDPESCVVSSMVDGARARGVVEFTGSPRELAQRCVAKFMR